MSGASVGIGLYGRFCVLSRAGADVTPKSAKAQALLVLLADAPELRRSRKWLQAMLWSDRGADQQAGSLRQTLVALRHALGPDADVLAADRVSVWLGRDAVTVLPGAPGADLVEDLHVADPAFRSWLAARRRAGGAPGHAPHPFVRTPPPRRQLFVRNTVAPAGTRERAIADALIDTVSRGLSEAMSVDVLSGDAGRMAPGSLLLTIATPDGVGGLRVVVEGQGGSGRQRLWARSTTALDGTSDASFDTLRFANAVIEAVGDAIFLRQTIDQRTEASLLARLAVRKIFSVRPGDLEEADRLLRQACEMDPRGLFFAWRAQLRVIQSVELHGVDPSVLLMEAEDQCFRALELEPNNSMVLATVSNARLALSRNILSSAELARRSVELNPGNPLAWDSLANASLYGGDARAAHQLAAVARRLGSSSPMTFWWDMGLCLTAVVNGKRDEATLLAERSAAMSPHFRPPLRYLAALYAADGREEDARHAASALRRLEPDFSFDRLAHDPSYPAQLLRKSPLFAADRIAALEG